MQATIHLPPSTTTLSSLPFLFIILFIYLPFSFFISRLFTSPIHLPPCGGRLLLSAEMDICEAEKRDAGFRAPSFLLELQEAWQCCHCSTDDEESGTVNLQGSAETGICLLIVCDHSFVFFCYNSIVINNLLTFVSVFVIFCTQWRTNPLAPTAKSNCIELNFFFSIFYSFRLS